MNTLFLHNVLKDNIWPKWISCLRNPRVWLSYSKASIGKNERQLSLEFRVLDALCNYVLLNTQFHDDKHQTRYYLYDTKIIHSAIDIIIAGYPAAYTFMYIFSVFIYHIYPSLDVPIRRLSD